MSPFAQFSALYSRNDNTLNEVALRKKEYPDWNESGNDRHGHQELDIDLGAAYEAVQSQSDREQFWRVEIDQWREELIPGPGKIEDCDDGEGRTRQRQQDTKQNAQTAAAVNERGVVQLSGNGQEKLS